MSAAKEKLETADHSSVSNNWHLKVPAVPPRLDDTLLPTFRHPREKIALATAVAILVGLLVGGLWLGYYRSEWKFLIGMAGTWLLLIFTASSAGAYNMLRGAEVTPTQFPALYQIVLELSQRYNVATPRVFVVRMFSLKAETFGFIAPYVIVLPSPMLDSLEPGELRYILGREIGSIRLGHPRARLLLGGDSNDQPELLKWIAKLKDLPFSWYSRLRVLSADRAGILACGSVRMAITVEIKLAIGSAQLADIDPAALIEQIFKLKQGASRFSSVLIRLQSISPPLVRRLEAMVEWAGMPEPPQATPQ